MLAQIDQLLDDSGPDISREFLGFLEDILNGMNKAEILLEGVSYSQFESDFR